jgi:hypothetical protein
VKTLPVFRSQSRIYHDITGKAHVAKNTQFFLMGHSFIESTASLAERDGKIYYQIVCLENGDFTNSVFVEDSVRRQYALVNLIAADVSPNHSHALFVDQKGNLFEGVAKKGGYRIYEWKILE